MEEQFDKIEFVDTPDELDIFKQQIEAAQIDDSVSDEQPIVQNEVVNQNEFVDNSVEQYSDEEVESAVLQYLSERLGTNYGSFDQVVQTINRPEPARLDEGLQAIADFVEQTGRSPYDWFLYQSLNPSEMDDLSVIKSSMKFEYPELTADDIDLMISRKYNLDEGLFEDSDRRLGAIQLRMDAKEARNKISEMRDQFMAPVATQRQQEEPEPFIDDNWIQAMSTELDTLEGVEFDLGDGKSFRYGLDSRYKNELRNKNVQLDQFFDPYVRNDGSWDYDLLNTHRAVIDNIDTIVKAVYKQGLGDGQRSIVSRAANVSQSSPSAASTQPSTPSIMEQLSPFFAGEKLTFKL